MDRLPHPFGLWLDEGPPPPHVCEYTTPVAWAYDYGWLSVDDQNERFVRLGQRVTALRCACGKEAPR